MENTNEQVINLGSLEKKPSGSALFLTLILLLAIVVGAGFALGFLFNEFTGGKSQQAVIKKSATVSAQKDGGQLFTDQTYNYQIKTPSGWTITEKKESVPGVILQAKRASVEVWVELEQPALFDDEQKAAIESTKKVKIKVDNREVEMTQYIYKAGNYLSVIILKGKSGNPTVTFWLKADEKDSFETAKTVVQSFKFL